MAEKTTYHIRCPGCGHEQAVELYESVNVRTDPVLRDQLMANQLNVVQCEGCRISFRVDKPLLYHDPDRRFLLYLLPLAEDQLPAGERHFAETLRRVQAALPGNSKPPAIGLILNRLELVERIFLHEAGLNERVVEYLKYMMYTRNPRRLDPDRKTILFNAQDSTDDPLCFVIQDVASRKLEGVLKYERKVYDALCEMFDRDEETPDLLELFPGPYISARALLRRESKEAAPRPPGTR